MDHQILGWALVGVLTLGNTLIFVRLISQLLKKQDLLEQKLMAMSTAYPHQAYLELQTQTAAAQMAAIQASQAPAGGPVGDWQTQQAS